MKATDSLKRVHDEESTIYPGNPRGSASIFIKV
jgi:hypothetical protein